MKCVIRFLSLILAALVLLLAVAYGALQTQYGAQALAWWLNKNSPYQIRFASLNYQLSAPSRFSLNQLQITLAAQSVTEKKPAVTEKPAPLLTARRLDWDFTLSPASSKLTLYQGSLALPTLSQKLPHMPLPARQIQLQNMTLMPYAPSAGTVTAADKTSWQLNKVNGIIRQQQASLLFQLSASDFVINNLHLQQLQLQGSLSAEKLTLSSINAQWLHGLLTASAERNPQGRWLLQQIRLDHPRWQSDLPVSQWLVQLQQQTGKLPDLELQRLILNNGQLEGNGWALNDLSVDLHHLSLSQGRWQGEQSEIAIQASEMVLAGEQFTQPALKATLSRQDLAGKLTSGWRKGNLLVSGRYLADQHRLALDNITAQRLEYPLPAHWRQFWQRPLPGWLQQISVAQASLQQTLLIDTNADFPFQFTALNANASHLQLARQGQWGIWQGDLQANALQATLNGVDLYQPVFQLHSSPLSLNGQLQSQLYRQPANTLSAPVSTGQLSATGSLCQCAAGTFQLQLTAQQAEKRMLTQWGWSEPLLAEQPNKPSAPAPQTSAPAPAKISHLHLQLNGRLQHLHLLPETLNGELLLNGLSANEQTTHLLRQGQWQH